MSALRATVLPRYSLATTGYAESVGDMFVRDAKRSSQLSCFLGVFLMKKFLNTGAKRAMTRFKQVDSNAIVVIDVISNFTENYN